MTPTRIDVDDQVPRRNQPTRALPGATPDLDEDTVGHMTGAHADAFGDGEYGQGLDGVADGCLMPLPEEMEVRRDRY